ncbi:Flp pilus assembly protein CpaB [Streptomyces sp. NP160]|uniref:SAF domain-containing protein n=1 Tax=Streptomyces sp. NP160 TaxID=2586637 RepID=UPI00111A4F67|nr:SAF domain-containing protein [Streptomyces sp. NP160]TNM66980.1 Flp pilus assembly protein CpaB [Streptomyces sp. NP160]
MTTTAWPPPQRRTAPSSPAPGAARRRLRRALRRSRRPLAAVLLACATALGVTALVPHEETGGGVPVLVAADDLPAGAAVAAGSRVAVLPPSAVPSGALGPADVDASGRAADARLAAPVRAGEVITDVRLSGGDVLASLAPGQVAVPVAVTSPLPDGLVVAGARVAVLAAAPEAPAVPEDEEGTAPASGLLVRSATVLVVSTDPLTTGLLAGGSGGTSVVLALDDDAAARVAAATADGGVVLARSA